MFTGIIQDVGTITGIEKTDDIVTFTVKSEKITPMLKNGDSVAVDGACLTVIGKEKGAFRIQAIPETLKRTISKHYRNGSRVNLEPAMQVSDRFHGHIVSGHVDFIGKISRVESSGKTTVMTVDYPPEYGKYFALKGSVTLNGVSLTIAKLTGKNFEVHIIPHTWDVTNLPETAKEMNIEVDLIARYLESLVNAKEDESNYFFLKERGFI